MDSAERAPWFSHQHDAAYLPGSDSLILLFDNGNTRQLSDPAANSRGQVLRLNERDRTASLVLNVDLGAYAPALGSAQWLPNGNYLFDVGLLLPGQSSRTVEVDGSGQVVHSFRLMQWQYRAYGMPDLYNTY